MKFDLRMVAAVLSIIFCAEAGAHDLVYATATPDCGSNTIDLKFETQGIPESENFRISYSLVDSQGDRVDGYLDFAGPANEYRWHYLSVAAESLNGPVTGEARLIQLSGPVDREPGIEVPFQWGETDAILGDYDGDNYPDDRNSSSFVVADCTSSGAVLGDFVWEDCNLNGLQDDTGTHPDTGMPVCPGGSGLAGVTVELLHPSEGGCNTGYETPIGNGIYTITGTDGRYLFTGLDAGEYCVRIMVPEGFECTAANQGENDLLDSDFVATPGANSELFCQSLNILADGTEINPIVLIDGEVQLHWDAGLHRPSDCTGNPAEDDGSSDDKSGDDGSSDDKSGDDGSSDDKSGDDGSSDDKSGDDGSSDDKSGDDGSSDDKSGDDGSSDDKSGDDGSSDDKSGDDGSSDDKSGDDGSSDDKSGDDGSSDDKSGDDGSSDDKSGDDGSSDDKSEDEAGSGPLSCEANDDPSADDGSSDGGSSDDGSSDDKSKDAKQKDKKPKSKKSKSDKSKDGKSKDDRSSDDKSKDDKSKDGESEDHGSDDH